MKSMSIWKVLLPVIMITMLTLALSCSRKDEHLKGEHPAAEEKSEQKKSDHPDRPKGSEEKTKEKKTEHPDHPK